MTDRNDMAYWFPPIWAEGLPTPETRIVETDVELSALLDGVKPEGYDEFFSELHGHVAEIGEGGPVFLRTGHTSGKHEWARTCWLRRPEDLALHVTMLVEHSGLVDMMGLPLRTWAVRAPIPTKVLFTCDAYLGFPVTREFRAFVGEAGVWHIQPYWPPNAVAQGAPTAPDWRATLAGVSKLVDEAERERLIRYATAARNAVVHHHDDDDGEWSVDLLQDRYGNWWVTDMAEAVRSFRWGAVSL